MTRYKQAVICIWQMTAFVFCDLSAASLRALCDHFPLIMRPIGQKKLLRPRIQTLLLRARLMLPQSQPDKAIARPGCFFTTRSRHFFFQYLQLYFLVSVFPATSMAFLHCASLLPQPGWYFRVSPQTLADRRVFFRQCSIEPDMYAAGHNTNSFSIIEARQLLLPNKT